jgi:hypothetical protein
VKYTQYCAVALQKPGQIPYINKRLQECSARITPPW